MKTIQWIKQRIKDKQETRQLIRELDLEQALNDNIDRTRHNVKRMSRYQQAEIKKQFKHTMF